MKSFKKLFSWINPYWLGTLVIVGILFFLFNSMQSLNKKCNRDLVQEHAELITKIHSHRSKVFKLRAQLSSLSDEHMIYLLRNPKLKNHAQYMHLTEHMMKVNDRDGNEIDDLQSDVHADHAKVLHAHPKSVTTNSLNPQKGKPFQELVGSAVSFIMLLAVGLFMGAVSGFRYRKRNHYRKLFGDDNGMKESNFDLKNNKN